MTQPSCEVPRSSIHSAQLGTSPATGDPRVLEHLTTIDFEPNVLDVPDEGFVPLKKTSAMGLLEAQINTTDWLKQLGADDDETVTTQAEKAAARDAFAAVTTDSPNAKNALLNLKVPAAVRKTVAMLTAYDWEFVQQAKEIRGKAVHQLVEEMEHPDARIRLKAIELLGKVTEVGLFTERVEVKKDQLADHELDERIREKLNQLSKTVETQAKEKEERNKDAEDVEVKEKPETPKADDGLQ